VDGFSSSDPALLTETAASLARAVGRGADQRGGPWRAAARCARPRPGGMGCHRRDTVPVPRPRPARAPPVVNGDPNELYKILKSKDSPRSSKPPGRRTKCARSRPDDARSVHEAKLRAVAGGQHALRRRWAGARRCVWGCWRRRYVTTRPLSKLMRPLPRRGRACRRCGLAPPAHDRRTPPHPEQVRARRATAGGASPAGAGRPRIRLGAVHGGQRQGQQGRRGGR
jgi:hypothetical protein